MAVARSPVKPWIRAAILFYGETFISARPIVGRPVITEPSVSPCEVLTTRLLNMKVLHTSIGMGMAVCAMHESSMELLPRELESISIA